MTVIMNISKVALHWMCRKVCVLTDKTDLAKFGNSVPVFESNKFVFWHYVLSVKKLINHVTITVT